MSCCVQSVEQVDIESLLATRDGNDEYMGQFQVADVLYFPSDYSAEMMSLVAHKQCKNVFHSILALDCFIVTY